MPEETLLDLINDCEPLAHEPYAEFNANAKPGLKLAKARELKELGFDELGAQIEKEYAPKIKLEKIARFCYRRITREKIEKFLQRKVALYNKEHEAPKPSINKKIDSSEYGLLLLQELQKERRSGMYFPIPEHIFFDRDEIVRQLNSISFSLARNDIIESHTCHYHGGGPVGKFVWTETRIEKYGGIPPAPVLEYFREHKKREVFDYFTIANVNEVKDPMLLGRIDDCDDRFFIAQWGDDVSLDDVI